MNTHKSRSAQATPQAEQKTTQAPTALDTEREDARAALDDLDDQLERAEMGLDEAFDAFPLLDDMADEAAREAGCDDAIDEARDALNDARVRLRQAIEALNSDAKDDEGG
jgi:exonuclease VII small subunit